MENYFFIKWINAVGGKRAEQKKMLVQEVQPYFCKPRWWHNLISIKKIQNEKQFPQQLLLEYSLVSPQKSDKLYSETGFVIFSMFILCRPHEVIWRSLCPTTYVC